MKFSCRLREEVAEERAVIRWLEAEGNYSDAVRAVLVAHVVGQGGVSMVTVNDKLDRLLRLAESGALVAGGPDGAPPADARPGDGLAYLDEMGL
jgi:hypothetical protein